MAKKDVTTLTLEQRALKGLKLTDSVNIITVLKDESCEMAEIQVNGEQVFEGHYMDYELRCFNGYKSDIGDIVYHRSKDLSPDSYAAMLKLFIAASGRKARIEHRPYTYTG